MSEMSLGRAVTRLADTRPDDPAVIEASGEVLTWRQLDRRSNSAARALIDRGVERDDVVALALSSGARFVTACIGIWKAGATPQPVPPQLPQAELDAVLQLAAPRLLVGDVASPGITQPGPDDLVVPDDGPLPDLWATSWKAPLSSGSTGVPKVIFSAAPARIDTDRPTASYIPRSAVQLTPAPLHHAAAFLFAMRGLTLGHTLVMLERFDAAACLRMIEQHRVTWSVFSPSAMLRIWRAPERERCDVSSVASVLHVGAACPQWLKRGWLDWLGPDRVDEIYSGTESIGVTHISGAEWLRKPGSVGRPAQGTSVRVVDAEGADVQVGTVGQVVLRPRGGPGSTYRYAGDAAGTAEQHDGHESLGDLGWLDEDGYLFLADREADVIDTDAGPVYPSSVETVIDAHPAVRSSAVLGRPAPGGHKDVHAVVDVGDASVDADTLLTWCRDRLEPRLVPAGVDVVHEPVRDDFGKVRRSALRS